MRTMHILIVLTYFQPHKSGLTVYAVRQAHALAQRGHDVTVLTSQYDPKLAQEEWDEGVRIVRMPVAFRLSKGVVMPGMPCKARKLIGRADVVNLHVPQMDAALLALLAKLMCKPVVLTYHCDLKMPKGFVNKIAGWAAYLTNFISAHLADVIVHNTRDFAEHSPFLSRFLNKLVVSPTPIVVESIAQRDITSFIGKYQIQSNQRIVGMVARLATEKGVEYLVEAMPVVLQALPNARVIFVGDYEHVFGEESYKAKLLPLIEKLGDHWTFLGVVSELEKAVFLQVCDVLVLPSINSTESFGMVQVEALVSGTPVVASDLPGVRQPVLSTGMGEIVPPRNSEALSQAINRVLDSGMKVSSDVVNHLRNQYAPDTIAAKYESLFEKVISDNE